MAVKNKILYELYDEIDANIPIFWIEHFDFAEVDEYIQKLKEYYQDLKPEIHEYRCGGEVNFENKFFLRKGFGENDSPEGSLIHFLEGHNDDCEADGLRILLLKDVTEMLRNPQVVTHIRMIAERSMLYRLDQKGFKVLIFLIGSEMFLPKEISHLTRVIRITPPPVEDIEEIIRKKQIPLSEDDLKKNALALKGLSELEINQVLSLLKCKKGQKVKLEDIITREKDQFIRKSKLLRVVQSNVSPDDIGGLEHLTAYLEQKRLIFAHPIEARDRKVDIPKGILIVGMPGCGKSLTAKVTASVFNLPLIQLDIGMLLGKYVGQSEENFRKAITMAETIAPCVLWIDEIEKAFAGMQAQGGANEVTTRLFGNFLTWMQEKNSPVYVVATSNSCKLPPEFYRRGRFDEIFSVALPNTAERKKILEIHLKKRNYSLEPNVLSELAQRTEGYCGADLEGIVKDAVERTFIESLNKGTSPSFINRAVIMGALAATPSIKESLGRKYEEMETTLKSFKLRPASK